MDNKDAFRVHDSNEACLANYDVFYRRQELELLLSATEHKGADQIVVAIKDRLVDHPVHDAFDATPAPPDLAINDFFINRSGINDRANDAVAVRLTDVAADADEFVVVKLK